MSLPHPPAKEQAGLVGQLTGRPVERTKGRDRGIDGRLYFKDHPAQKTPNQIILSVKGGKTGPAHVRDLRGVVERESRHGAVMGALLTLEEPTQEMDREAVSAGYYKSPWGGRFQKIQTLPVRALLAGRGLNYPAPGQTNVSLRKAKPRELAPRQGTLPGIASTSPSVTRSKRRTR